MYYNPVLISESMIKLLSVLIDTGLLLVNIEQLGCSVYKTILSKASRYFTYVLV